MMYLGLRNILGVFVSAIVSVYVEDPLNNVLISMVKITSVAYVDTMIIIVINGNNFSKLTPRLFTSLIFRLVRQQWMQCCVRLNCIADWNSNDWTLVMFCGVPNDVIIVRMLNPWNLTMECSIGLWR